MRKTSLRGLGACQVFVGCRKEKESPDAILCGLQRPVPPHEVGQHPNLRQIESPTPLVHEGWQGQVAGATLVTATHQMLIQSSR